MSADRTRRAQLEVLQASVRELRGTDDVQALAAAVKAIEARQHELEAALAREQEAHDAARAELDEVADLVATQVQLRAPVPEVHGGKRSTSPLESLLIASVVLMMGGSVVGRLMNDIAPVLVPILSGSAVLLAAWVGDRQGQVKVALKRAERQRAAP